MMTKADAIYFIDPIGDDAAKAKKVLVTDEYYGRENFKDEVRTVKQHRTMMGGKLWYTDEASGNYIYGIPVSPTTSDYKEVIAIDGDVVLLGMSSSIMETAEEILLANVLRSDRLTVPGVGAELRGERRMVSDWMHAAPWARDLFPAVDDSDEVVALKLEVAKEKHRHRKAHGEILRQSVARNWSDELQELREKHGSLPTPVYAALVNADLFLETTETINVDTEDMKSKMAELQARAVSSVSAARPAVTVNTTFIAPCAMSDTEKVQGLQSTHVQSYARDYFNDYSLRVGSYSITPVLRSASAL